MSRSFCLGSHRFLLAVVASLLLGLSCAAASASAATTEANCGNLQTKLEAAGTGDVVVLSELCGGSYTLPSSAAFTLEGAPGATAGFDGADLTPPQLLGTSVGALTLSNLTFEHSGAASEGALVLYHEGGGSLMLNGDRFVEDMTNQPSPIQIVDDNSASHCPGGVANGSVSIENSLFQGNVGGNGTDGEGGGMVLRIECGLDGVTLAGDTFNGNTLKPASGFSDFGGGLAIRGEDSSNLAHVTQTGNVFAGNGIVAAGASDYAGGGEATSGVDLASTGDRFSGNTLPGAGTGDYSWGAGLSIEDDNCQAMAPASTLTDDVVAANTIADTGSDDPTAAQGAGIYVGCSQPAGFSNHLTVLDSSVTANMVSPAGEGAVAGIDGHPNDHLALENSILSGDGGGAELGGFDGESGALTATYSDLCIGSAPFAGVGNICAAPLLQDASTGDVHETSASPTIDAGSNVLVPSGLTTDAFGTTRILPGHAGCTGGFPAVVDIGAAEFQPAVPSCPPPVPPPPPPAPGLTHFVSLKTSAKGIALRLSCVSTDGLGCSGTIFLTANETHLGKKVIAVTASHRTMTSVRLGQGTFALAAGATATFQVKLNATGQALLRRFHSFSSFVLANEAGPTGTPLIFLLHSVRFSEHKKPKKHKSKKHRPKRGSRHSKHPKHH